MTEPDQIHADLPGSPPAGVRPYGFSDPEHYVEAITYAIWNGPDRDPRLVRRWYDAQTPLHADAGDLVGAEAVALSTEARLEAFPDFHGTIAETLWTGDEEHGYRTSMRWTWTGTNTGPSPFGPPTGRAVHFSAIANCVVRGEVIVEEWLASNRLSLARQLGLAEVVPDVVRDSAGRGARPTWVAEPKGPGLVITDIWDRVLNGGDLSAVLEGYAVDAHQQRGVDRSANGAEEIRSWFAALLESGEHWAWSVDDSYWRPGPKGRDRVATQWTLRGVVGGVVGGRELRVCGISHHHVQDGRIVAEWTEYDQLALARQGGTEI